LERYRSASSKMEKSQIVTLIVDAVRDGGAEGIDAEDRGDDEDGGGQDEVGGGGGGGGGGTSEAKPPQRRVAGSWPGYVPRRQLLLFGAQTASASSTSSGERAVRLLL
jgi:hypothetical protein